MFFFVHEVCVWVLMSRNSVIFKQDRQCTYNMTMRRVLATIVVVEKLNVYL